MVQAGTLWEMTERAQIITLIGAGGKTSTMMKLAEEISKCRLPVVMTTTTKVYPVLHSEPRLLRVEPWRNQRISPPLGMNLSFWYAKQEEVEGKWIGPAKTHVDHEISCDISRNNSRCWIIEGDGARGKKLKFWGEHEPQIPDQTGYCVLLLDAGLWGNPLRPDDVHHPERFPGLLGRSFTLEVFWEYLKHSPLAGRDHGSRPNSWVILLNVRGEVHEESLEILQQVSISMLPQHLRQQQKQNSAWRVALGNVLTGRVRWVELR